MREIYGSVGPHCDVSHRAVSQLITSRLQREQALPSGPLCDLANRVRLIFLPTHLPESYDTSSSRPTSAAESTSAAIIVRRGGLARSCCCLPLAFLPVDDALDTRMKGNGHSPMLSHGPSVGRACNKMDESIRVCSVNTAPAAPAERGQRACPHLSTRGQLPQCFRGRRRGGISQCVQPSRTSQSPERRAESPPKRWKGLTDVRHHLPLLLSGCSEDEVGELHGWRHAYVQGARVRCCSRALLE